MADTILKYWPRSFRKLLGPDGWPRSYCCVDTETSGFSPESDVIVEWGHTLVEDGEIVDQMSVYLDWTNDPRIEPQWLRYRLETVCKHYAEKNVPCVITYDKLAAEGWEPDKALDFIRDFTAAIKAKGILFVAHNGFFDERMLSANFIRFGSDPRGFTFGANGWIDTNYIEKANQRVEHARMHPDLSDTLRSYWQRINTTRIKGVTSSLDTHCWTKYGFDTRHGISRDEMHGAMMDTHCCHLLMQEFGGSIPPLASAGDVFRGAPPPPVRNASRERITPGPAPVAGPRKNYRGQRNS